MSGALKYGFEPRESLAKHFIFAGKVSPSILDVSSFKKDREAMPPQTIDSIINGLFLQIEQEILIPILRAKNIKQLEQEFENKIREFLELRRSIISVFTSFIHKNKDAEKKSRIKSRKAMQDIIGFFENEAEKYIGFDEALSVISLLKTWNQVRDGLDRICEQDSTKKEQFIKENFQKLIELEFFSTMSDLSLYCLLLALKKGVTFQIKEQVLKQLTVICEVINMELYHSAKELGIIYYSYVSEDEIESFESDDEDRLLANAGLKSYNKILKQEGY